jgi:hypothetical protein
MKNSRSINHPAIRFFHPDILVLSDTSHPVFILLSARSRAKWQGRIAEAGLVTSRMSHTMSCGKLMQMLQIVNCRCLQMARARRKIPQNQSFSADSQCGRR